MPEPVKYALTTIQELTSAQTIQAIITIAVTIALLFMLVNGQDVPQMLQIAWFTLLGLYFEVPSKAKTS